MVFSDCGIGLGPTSLRNTVMKLKSRLHAQQYPNAEENISPINFATVNWIPFSNLSKLSFVCLGHTNDTYFRESMKLYQEFLDASGQDGELFVLKLPEFVENVRGIKEEASYNQQIFDSVKTVVDKMCDSNYTPFEALLKCGGYFRLESPIIIWPTPLVSYNMLPVVAL